MYESYKEISEGITGYVYIGTAIFLLLAVLFIIFLTMAVKKRRRLYKNQEELRIKFQQELLKSQLEIQEQTLKNISQEIHDNIGQALSLAKLNLNTLYVQDTEVQEKILNSKYLVSKAIADLRSLSRSLDTDYVKEMGLQRAIEYELDMIRKTGTIKTGMEVDGSVIRLEKQKELILFRIVQETLNNIIKHAQANKIELLLSYGAEQIELKICDDGVGVDLGPLNDNNGNSGLGIKNMHSRAMLIGADFSMQSSPGNGTTVKIFLPIEYLNDENKRQSHSGIS